MKWLALARYVGQNADFTPGEVVDDRYFDVGALRAAGAALVPYNEAAHKPLVDAFKGQASVPGAAKDMGAVMASRGFFPGQGGGAAVQHVYVRAADGNDANSGTEPTRPLATLKAAVAQVPRVLTENMYVHIGPGDYVLPADFRWPEPVLMNRARLVYMGDGGGDDNAEFYVEVVSGTVSAVGSGTVTPSFALASDDVYSGTTLQVLDGAAEGALRLVQGNDTSDLLVYDDPGLSPGDAIRLVRPAARILLDQENAPDISSSAPSLSGNNEMFDYMESFTQFVNVAFERGPSIGAGVDVLMLMRGAFVMTGVYLGDFVRVRCTGASALFAGSPKSPSGYGALQPSDPDHWEGWGLYQAVHDVNDFSSGEVSALYGALVIGTFALNRTGAYAQGYFNFTSGSRVAQLNMNERGIARFLSSIARGNHNTATVWNQQDSFIQFFGGNVADNTGTGRAIYNTNLGRTYAFPFGGGLSGNAAGGVGVDCDKGGQFLFEGALGMTGATADTRVDGTTQTAAFYSGAGVGEADAVTGSRCARV